MADDAPLPELTRAAALADELHDLLDAAASKLIPAHGLGSDETEAIIAASKGVVDVRRACGQLLGRSSSVWFGGGFPTLAPRRG